MATVIPTKPITDAILARLREALTCGDATKPDGVATTRNGLPKDPYAVLYPRDEDESGGSIGDPRQWAWIRYQVTVVGGLRNQAEHGQGLVRAQLVGWAPTVTGWRCGPIELDDPSGVDRDDDATPPMFFTTDQYRLYIAAA